MSDNARGRRTPARSHGSRVAQEPGRRTSQPARRGGEPAGGPAWRGGKPAGAARRGGRPSRPVRPAQPDPYAGLDRALSDAAAQPAPESASFSQLGLPERLISALATRNIHEPFAIQARALPDAMAGRDVLGRAQTGSGKTLAFGLPMLTRLAGAAGPKGAPRGLVLVPTRELAQQVADVLTPLGRSVGVTVTTVYGGVPYGRQITQLRNGVDIVVATPGRLIDLLDRKACTLTGIEITVLDEADHMADLGFLPAVTRILDETPAGGQRLLFSATLDRRVGQLVTRYLNDPALHAVTPQAETESVAEHSVLVLHAEDKLPVAAEIASRPARTLFFVRTKHGADRLARQLSRAGVAAEAIHGNRNQNQRQRALDAFASGHPRVLVATDVAARGIHVDDVELVVHFDPPNDHKDYLHRSGRTARAGASGLVVTLAEEGQVRELQRMHDAAGVSAPRHHVGVGHHLVQEIATSGTPVPPAPPAPPAAAHSGAKRRRPRNVSGDRSYAPRQGSQSRGSQTRGGRGGQPYRGQRGAA
jgi:superfamily II DNA/RNA helicase